MLWFRDKAYKMVKPSIDRKDANKNYTIDNCRYIELKENYRPTVILVVCPGCESNNIKHKAKGLCLKCYTKMRNKIYKGK